MPKYWIQSQGNKQIAPPDSAEVISMANTTNEDLVIRSVMLKFDSALTGLGYQQFALKTTKSSDNLWYIGYAVLGTEATPIDLPFDRLIIPSKRFVISKADGIALTINKASIAIPANSIFLRVEFESV